MTYDQYWYGDPLMVRAFYKASQLELDRINSQAWLNGLYVYRALVVSISNALSGGKGEALEYPSEPYNFHQKDLSEQDESEWSDQDPDAMFAKAYMMQMVQAGRNWGNRSQKVDNASHEDVIMNG